MSAAVQLEIVGFAPVVEVAPVRRRAADAARQRRKRRREREGTKPAQIEVDYGRAVSAIKRRDGLTELEAEALTWPEIEHEVQAVWDGWLRQWAK
jgi:hypothetical protein